MLWRKLALLAISIVWSVTAAHAADPCRDSIDLDYQASLQYQRWLSMSVPVSANDTVRDLEIETVNDPDSYGPEYRETGGRKVIFVPSGFRTLQCRVAVLTWIGNETPDDELLAKMQQGFGQCRQSSPAVACLARIVDQAWPATLAKVTETQFGPVRGIADDAFKGILLHEAGHAVLRHGDTSASNADGAKQEFDADIFAITQLSLTGRPGLALFYTFALPAALGVDEAPTYDSWVCRADNSVFVGSNFTSALVLGYFPLDQTVAQKFRDARRALLADLAAGRNESFFGGGKRNPQCDARGLTSLQPIKTDFRALARFLDARVDTLPPQHETAAGLAFLNDLLAVPMTTPQGKAMHARLLSHYLRTYSLVARDDGYLSFMQALIRPAISSNFVSRDFGRLLGAVGVDTYHAQPATGALTIDTKPLHAILDAAHQYNPEFSEAYLVHGLLYLREGACPQALSALRVGLATSTADDNETLTAIIARLEGDVRAGTCSFKK